MFSLTYTPAYDPYHTTFRLLVLLTCAKDHTFTYRAARAADFFLCFPWALEGVRAPSNVEGFRKDRNGIVRNYPKSNYDHFPSARTVFERMEMIQATAVSALAGSKMIDPNALRTDTLVLVQNVLPKELRSSINEFRERKPDLVNFLALSFPKIGDLGKDGIFARSGLGEFSYDVV
ncbi:ABC-three component system middle component 5 [Falsihalocynthiibacter sp. S25ZX9]|uniref:ABC-three component system middle component 5 n=1 Tax=Falsihalocynthiibacter sp. S25ZX9 TaxID=3240870 RepID=UPI00350F847F